MVLLEAGLPQINQSAYIKSVSCEDETFAKQDVIVKSVHDGSSVNMCLYEMQKAFDSVEYCVLLERLFSVRVNGKCCIVGMRMCDAECVLMVPCHLSFVLKGGLDRALFCLLCCCL